MASAGLYPGPGQYLNEKWETVPTTPGLLNNSLVTPEEARAIGRTYNKSVVESDYYTNEESDGSMIDLVDLGWEIPKNPTTNSKNQKELDKKVELFSLSIESEKLEPKTYPEDVWHLISGYIAPEGISTFARLCKGAYGVTQKASFWRKLFDRYYNPENPEQLPTGITPESIERKYGIKLAVVRSLFRIYNPFVQRLSTERSKGNDPSTLIGRTLDSFLQFKDPYGNILINFKLKDTGALEIVRPQTGDPLDELDNIEANPERDFKVLQLMSRCSYAFIPPTIYGQTFLALKTSLNRNLFSISMNLIFGPSHLLNACRPEKLSLTNLPAGTTCVLVEHVECNHVLGYWHPRYPHSEYMIPSNALRSRDRDYEDEDAQPAALVEPPDEWDSWP